jgi:hypothetical protein
MTFAQVGMSLFQPVLWTSAFVLDMIAITCAHVETCLLWAFEFHSSTTFRMLAEFPETTAIPGDPYFLAQHARLARLVALTCLSILPYLASVEGRMSWKGPVGRLVGSLTRKNKYAAYVIMLMREWLVVAAWNTTMIHVLQTGSLYILMVTTPFLTVLF